MAENVDRPSNQHVCPRCGLPIAYGETQVGDTECGVAHTPERCCALLRMAWAARGAEIERLRAGLVELRDEIEVVMHGEYGADWADHFAPLFNLVQRAKTLEGSADETSELSRALHVIDEAGKLSDWINRARPVITELMEAYARLVRSHSGMGAMELAEVQPWRCMEYIGAEELLRAQPVAIVEITAEKATEEHSP